MTKKGYWQDRAIQLAEQRTQLQKENKQLKAERQELYKTLESNVKSIAELQREIEVLNIEKEHLKERCLVLCDKSVNLQEQLASVPTWENLLEIIKDMEDPSKEFKCQVLCIENFIIHLQMKYPAWCKGTQEVEPVGCISPNMSVIISCAKCGYEYPECQAYRQMERRDLVYSNETVFGDKVDITAKEPETPQEAKCPKCGCSMKWHYIINSYSKNHKVCCSNCGYDGCVQEPEQPNPSGNPKTMGADVGGKASKQLTDSTDEPEQPKSRQCEYCGKQIQDGETYNKSNIGTGFIHTKCYDMVWYQIKKEQHKCDYCQSPMTTPCDELDGKPVWVCQDCIDKIQKEKEQPQETKLDKCKVCKGMGKWSHYDEETGDQCYHNSCEVCKGTGLAKLSTVKEPEQTKVHGYCPTPIDEKPQELCKNCGHPIFQQPDKTWSHSCPQFNSHECYHRDSNNNRDCDCKDPQLDAPQTKGSDIMKILIEVDKKKNRIPDDTEDFLSALYNFMSDYAQDPQVSILEDDAKIVMPDAPQKPCPCENNEMCEVGCKLFTDAINKETGFNKEKYAEYCEHIKSCKECKKKLENEDAPQSEFKANFLWNERDELSKLLYEFANAKTEEYREEIYKSILTDIKLIAPQSPEPLQVGNRAEVIKCGTIQYLINVLEQPKAEAPFEHLIKNPISDEKLTSQNYRKIQESKAEAPELPIFENDVLMLIQKIKTVELIQDGFGKKIEALEQNKQFRAEIEHSLDTRIMELEKSLQNNNIVANAKCDALKAICKQIEKSLQEFISLYNTQDEQNRRLKDDHDLLKENCSKMWKELQNKSHHKKVGGR